ncbi:unnamed protein product [Paramecium pentaurelia]|uniref:Uncharacterized protein n=1 Tax=Paramecium pentaurelia TaxID=43138 RepID=A0A8S1YIM4_9CILI|nr:unnamed protein product [Paramecium pentaurelia]
MFIQFILFQFLRIIVEKYYPQHFVISSKTDDEGWLIKNPYNRASKHTYSCVVKIYMEDIRYLDVAHQLKLRC